MQENANNLLLSNTKLKRLVLSSYVENIGLPLYLLWANGSFFFGFVGGFAFLGSVTNEDWQDKIWLFGGSALAGTIAFALLIWNLVQQLKGTDCRKLTFDEPNVIITCEAHKFNFGMLEHILFEQDFAEVEFYARDKKVRTWIFVEYRKGHHFSEGEKVLFSFDAWATPKQLEQLQAAYLRTMLVVKSKRKIQRELHGEFETKAESSDLQGMAEIIGKIQSKSIVEQANLLESEDARDSIKMIYGTPLPSGNKVIVDKSISLLSRLGDLFIFFVAFLAAFMNFFLLKAMF